MTPFGHFFFRLLFSGRVVLDRAFLSLRRLVRVGANGRDGREALVFAFFGFVRVSVFVFETRRRRRRLRLLLEKKSRRRRGIRVARNFDRRRVRRLRERRVFSPVVRESFGSVRYLQCRVPFLFFFRTRVFFRRVRLRRVFVAIRARRKSRLLFLVLLLLLLLLVLLDLLVLHVLLLLLLRITLLQRHLRHRVAHLANLRLGVREECRRERERRKGRRRRRGARIARLGGDNNRVGAYPRGA